MKTIKKFWVIPLAFLLTFTMCKKDEESEQLPTEVEVSFLGNKVSPQFKSGNVPDCSVETVDYAKIKINGVYYFPEVFYLTINNDTKPYTQAIKLPYNPGITYTVEEFHFIDDNQTPNDDTDDIIIASTPIAGSEFAGYIQKPLSFVIDVLELDKIEIPVEVLCFEPDLWEAFGFDWFAVEEITLREECFFGDLCVKNPNEYAGSLYASQSSGLQIDMPAIAKIEVYHNGTFVETFSNEAWLGEGQPLCVTYADYDNYVDQFEFVLYILVKSGTDFQYVPFKTWSIIDDEVIPQGTDGIVDFALGMCSPDADFIFPPYMNLPANATFKVGTAGGAGILGGYFDGVISNVSGGYDIHNGSFASWCFDHQVDITVGTSYDMDVYSSLYPEFGPSFLANEEWDRANWIMNHLDWYPGHTWEDIQGAFWLLDSPVWNGVAHGGVSSLSDLAFAQQMHDDAVQYGDGYMPLPGGYAAVVFIKDGTGSAPIVQTVFIVVDP